MKDYTAVLSLPNFQDKAKKVPLLPVTWPILKEMFKFAYPKLFISYIIVYIITIQQKNSS